MNYSYLQSGGITGVRFGLNGDTRDLPVAHKKVLESLLNQQPQIEPPNAVTKDSLKYHLQLNEAGKTTNLDFDDTNLPAALESLIEYLRLNASMI
jgi:hypothetical protein